MKKFLLVEDSQIVVKIIKHLIKDQPGMHCDVAMSRQEAESILAKNGAEQYLAAVVDLSLPDAPDGEVVDITLQAKLPTIVLTGCMEDTLRDRMFEKPIVDYIVKENRFSYEYAIKLLKRLNGNRDITVLVVDDSKISRHFTKTLLTSQLLNVLEAEDGKDALEIIQTNRDIKLLITDYNMPVMNGIELTKNIRKDPTRNDLVIIGISTHGNKGLSAKFIKNGANDFLTKPFSHEEFTCRIIHNIESLENYNKIRQMAYSDYLTNLPNRRYFYEHCDSILENSKEHGTPVCLTLIDIDHFKKINDLHGHDIGDRVLIVFAEILSLSFSRFLFARTGGEEFCVLLQGLNLNKAATLLENFREVVEDRIVMLETCNLSITISAGLVESNGNQIDELMREADQLLYQAKSNGRNQICWDAGP